MSAERRLRIATYNIHKCRGMDGRLRPDRVAAVLREIDADIVALQEVVSRKDGCREDHQARYLAEESGREFVLGETRQLHGAAYGNVTLTRLPVELSRCYDLTIGKREPRGCLRTDLTWDGQPLHVFNVHLGTSFLERRHQGRNLVAGDLLTDPLLIAPRIILGDFNEWTRGLASRLLSSHLASADIRHHLQRRNTYPGLLPFMHLDHIYYEQTLTLERLHLHRSRTALAASDHLPLVADILIGS